MNIRPLIGITAYSSLPRLDGPRSPRLVLQPRAADPDESIELDLRVGGVWRQRMVIDDETEFMTGEAYREIVPDEKLVFSWGATDGLPKLDLDRPDESPLVTVQHEEDGGTEMTVHVELPAHLSEDEVQEWFSMGARNGWKLTVDRPAAELRGRG